MSYDYGFDPEDYPYCCGVPMEYHFETDRWVCVECDFCLSNETQAAFQELDAA